MGEVEIDLPSAEDPTADVAIDNVLQQLVEQDLETAMAKLSPIERQVIELRFALKDGKPWSFRAIGRELGISKSWACELEARALAKIRS